MAIPGQGVDALGKPAIDPTENVLNLVRAESKRQDDLRTMQADHMRELMARDRETADRLREIETARLDAIRAVDQGQIQRSAEVSAQVATTLAGQVASSAEAFRVSLAASLEPIQKDIADLRRVQYEQAGQKSQVVETRAKSSGLGQWTAIIVSAILGVVTLSVSIILALT